LSKEITTYYNNLAKEYDKDRFENSYGQYIHTQEERIVSQFLTTSNISDNLDLACGTGRFLKYAQHGSDISKEMIKMANEKLQSKNLSVESAQATTFRDKSFQNITCFHLMMHLDNKVLQEILAEANRIMRKGGLFIFDIPSYKRRKLKSARKEKWHGSNSISKNNLLQLIDKKWELVSYQGVAFFPIHRIPKPLRKYVIHLDNLFCNSILKEYSSHLVFILKKRWLRNSSLKVSKSESK